jgi:hypothetical protein
LQLLLLRAKSGVDPTKAATPVEQKAMLTIKMQYPTDADVLWYILHTIMDYKSGHCKCIDVIPCIFDNASSVGVDDLCSLCDRQYLLCS